MKDIQTTINPSDGAALKEHNEALIQAIEAIFPESNPDQFNVNGINEFFKLIKKIPLLAIDLNILLTSGPHQGHSAFWTLTYIMNSSFNGLIKAQQSNAEKDILDQLQNTCILFQQVIINVIRNTPFERLNYNFVSENNESIVTLLSISACNGLQEPILTLFSMLTPNQISKLDLNIPSSSIHNAGKTPLWWLAQALKRGASVALNVYLNKAPFDTIKALNIEAKSDANAVAPDISIRSLLENTIWQVEWELATPLAAVDKLFMEGNIDSSKVQAIHSHLNAAKDILEKYGTNETLSENRFYRKYVFYCALKSAYEKFIAEKRPSKEDEKAIYDDLMGKARLAQQENPFENTIYLLTIFLKQIQNFDLLGAITNQIPPQNPWFQNANKDLATLFLDRAVGEQDKNISKQLYQAAWLSAFKANDKSICYNVSYNYFYGTEPNPKEDKDHDLENQSLLDLHFSRLDLLKELQSMKGK